MTNKFCSGKAIIRKLSNTKIGASAKLYDRQGEFRGDVLFYDFADGTIVVCTLFGLPQTQTNIFGFHIHQEGICEDDFSSAGPHFDMDENLHPNHSGDMPVLFGNQGNAYLSFYTDRFVPKDVIGRSVVVHALPDDYTSQPAGNSGERIICGIIV